MNEKQLIQMASKEGFIAALDQSGGSTPKALKVYGVTEDSYENEEEMFNLVHEMRTRIIKSAPFSSDKVIGAILFERTMNSKIDDLYTSDYLWNKKGIIPFLKVDSGLEPESNGVQMMKAMPNLDELLKEAVNKNIFGTKMRSVIKEANDEAIKKVVEQQFEIGKKIISYGLVPIIEPEVDIHSTEKEKCEKILIGYIKENLNKLDKNSKVILKLTLPSIDDFYFDLLQDEHILRIVALSGGYSREEANKKLSNNHGVIASFSRALSEGLNVNQTNEEFENVLEKSIDEIFKASIQ